MPTKVSVEAPIDAGFVPQRDIWVQLRNAPATYAHDQALLVCELDADEWVAWVPGYGELCLKRSQFHRIGDAD
ncbi:hypothetical protein IQ266_24555 [filamentous cyanobacterium LEGE 11480]|uniref:Uncharacterized protein n=2 Tax=Romeriopsis TaxID=2992131 RepID=A0A928Z4R7_9CYAN|nr:hypothetical protein [Romeriopsis navalis LEGE 11480]